MRGETRSEIGREVVVGEDVLPCHLPVWARLIHVAGRAVWNEDVRRMYSGRSNHRTSQTRTIREGPLFGVLLIEAVHLSVVPCRHRGIPTMRDVCHRLLEPSRPKENHARSGLACRARHRAGITLEKII